MKKNENNTINMARIYLNIAINLSDSILKILLIFHFSQPNHFENFFQKMSSSIQNIEIDVHITLEELCQRKIKILNYNAKQACSCVSLSSSKICSTCNGKGVQTHITKNENMRFMKQTECLSCKRTGKVYNFCSNCKDGLINVDKTVNIHLTPQHENGFRFIFSKQGNQNINKDTSDLICNLKYQKHDIFEVKNKDLYVFIKLSLKEALCGFVRNIKHPNGNNIPLMINDVVSHKNNHIIKGYGMVENESNLIISYDVEFPDKLNEKTKESLKQILD